MWFFYTKRKKEFKTKDQVSNLPIFSKYQNNNVQKQPPRGVLKKRCSENMQHALRHGCSPVILLHISRTTFPRNTSGWMLLKTFTEEFQWLLLTFNWCFQRSSEQKPLWLSAMNTRFSWKKRLLMEVWIWYRCQKRIENYHHDNEQFKNRKKYISKHSA